MRVTVDSEVIGVGDGKIKNKIRFILNYRNVKELFLQNIFESTNLFRPTAWAKHFLHEIQKIVAWILLRMQKVSDCVETLRVGSCGEVGKPFLGS